MVAASASARRPASTTFQPAFRNAIEVARPTPLPAPVISATDLFALMFVASRFEACELT
jgi:hypothetical protein